MRSIDVESKRSAGRTATFLESSIAELTFLPIVLTVIALAASAHPQQPAPTVQLNVPYSCQDGITRTVLRCEANPRFELCWWRDMRNGQPDEGYGRRDLMEDWMKSCKVATSAPRPAQPSASSPAPAAQPPRPQPVAPATPAAPVRNDPGTLAVRRCLELGGSAIDCMGQGFMTGITDFVGLNPSRLETVLNPAGIRIGGIYTAQGGPSIVFVNGDARISSCGKLEPEARPYTVTKRGIQLQVEISNQPKPLILVFGADSRFTGPAAFDITGRMITGYRTEVVEERRVFDNSVVTRQEQQVPVYQNRTQSCAFASLRATAPVRRLTTADTLSTLLGGQTSPASQSAIAEAPAGPRMGGKYTGPGGLQLEFQETAAVMDCGEAHVMRPYDVQNLSDRMVVTVRNANVPLTLTLRPDGTLAGSGTVEVAGRILTGLPDSGPTFRPVTTRCPVSTLTAQ